MPDGYGWNHNVGFRVLGDRNEHPIRIRSLEGCDPTAQRFRRLAATHAAASVRATRRADTSGWNSGTEVLVLPLVVVLLVGVDVVVGLVLDTTKVIGILDIVTVVTPSTVTVVAMLDIVTVVTPATVTVVAMLDIVTVV